MCCFSPHRASPSNTAACLIDHRFALNVVIARTVRDLAPSFVRYAYVRVRLIRAELPFREITQNAHCAIKTIIKILYILQVTIQVCSYSNFYVKKRSSSIPERVAGSLNARKIGGTWQQPPCLRSRTHSPSSASATVSFIGHVDRKNLKEQRGGEEGKRRMLLRGVTGGTSFSERASDRSKGGNNARRVAPHPPPLPYLYASKEPPARC